MTGMNLVRNLTAATILAGVWSQGTAQSSATEIDGVVFPDAVETDAGRLVLSGCGTREVLWHDVYAIGLYFPAPVRDQAAVLDPAQAKTVRIQVLFQGDFPEDMPEEWRDHLDDLLRRDIFRTFKDLYRELETGNVVTLSYAPETGTKVALNGDLTIQTAGHKTIDAFLNLWLGAEPVSKNLRRLLLSGSC